MKTIIGTRVRSSIGTWVSPYFRPEDGKRSKAALPEAVAVKAALPEAVAVKAALPGKGKPRRVRDIPKDWKPDDAHVEPSAFSNGTKENAIARLEKTVREVKPDTQEYDHTCTSENCRNYGKVFPGIPNAWRCECGRKFSLRKRN